MKADITGLFPMGSFNAKKQKQKHKTKQDKTKNSEKILKREN